MILLIFGQKIAFKNWKPSFDCPQSSCPTRYQKILSGISFKFICHTMKFHNCQHNINHLANPSSIQCAAVRANLSLMITPVHNPSSCLRSLFWSSESSDDSTRFLNAPQTGKNIRKSNLFLLCKICRSAFHLNRVNTAVAPSYQTFT